MFRFRFGLLLFFFYQAVIRTSSFLTCIIFFGVHSYQDSDVDGNGCFLAKKVPAGKNAVM